MDEIMKGVNKISKDYNFSDKINKLLAEMNLKVVKSGYTYNPRNKRHFMYFAIDKDFNAIHQAVEQKGTKIPFGILFNNIPDYMQLEFTRGHLYIEIFGYEENIDNTKINTLGLNLINFVIYLQKKLEERNKSYESE